MPIFKRKRSVDEILSVFSDVVADLKERATDARTDALLNREEASKLNREAESLESEAARADVAAAEITKLIPPAYAPPA